VKAEMKTSLVITTISAPTPAMREFAAESQQHGMDFIVMGDSASPRDFVLSGCDYYSVDRQLETGFRYADEAPLRHYARKNIGYLVAMANGSDVIVESDDDNYPLPAFWSKRQRIRRAHVFERTGWLNVYGHFSDARIWPRGFPLDAIALPVARLEEAPVQDADCPIQQGLCNGDPDVDAIYRLVSPLPIDFSDGNALALGNSSWCPFNSQNTTWWRDAFPLLYLPGTCSVRMTDIWRSFVAQRIAWTNGWKVLFHGPTVYQERNAHNLMRDFADEVGGYLNNPKIADRFEALALNAGFENIPENLRLCYQEFVDLRLVETHELSLLENWLWDIAGLLSMNCRSQGAEC
jgi:hypothetical protein